MMNKEKSLIKKAQKGQIDAFEKLITMYEKKVYNLAFSMFQNEHDAYDVAQEVFIKVYQSLHTFNFTSKFTTWLHRITVNTAIDEMRKRKAKPTESMDELIETPTTYINKQYTDDGLSPEDQTIKKENQKEMFQLLNQLTEDHKTILILRDVKEYTYEEISEILSCSIGTVKSRISRARSKLKELYLKDLEQKNKPFVK